MRVEMMKTGIDGEENEQDFQAQSREQKKSTLQADGTLLLTAPRRESAVTKFFKKRRNTTTKVVLFGGDNRVPFMALYQVLGLVAASL